MTSRIEQLQNQTSDLWRVNSALSDTLEYLKGKRPSQGTLSSFKADNTFQQKSFSLQVDTISLSVSAKTLIASAEVNASKPYDSAEDPRSSVSTEASDTPVISEKEKFEAAKAEWAEVMNKANWDKAYENIDQVIEETRKRGFSITMVMDKPTVDDETTGYRGGSYFHQLTVTRDKDDVERIDPNQAVAYAAALLKHVTGHYDGDNFFTVGLAGLLTGHPMAGKQFDVQGDSRFTRDDPRNNV